MFRMACVAAVAACVATLAPERAHATALHAVVPAVHVTGDSGDGCTVKRRGRSRLLEMGRVVHGPGIPFTRDAFRTLVMPPLKPMRKARARGVACMG